MLSLKTNFSDGDVLYAGAITSTSSVNGITTTVNSNTITKLMYAGSDLTGGTIASSVTETTLATVTIPANTIATGAVYIASLKGKAQAAAGNTSTWRIKSGVAASETTRQTVTVVNVTADESGSSIVWYDTAPTWTAPVNVIVTGQNSNDDANSQTTVNSLVAIGF